MAAPELGGPTKYLLVDLDGTLLGNRNLSLSWDFMRQAVGTLRRYLGLKKSVKTLIEINREFRKVSREMTIDLRVLQLFSQRANLSIEESRKFFKESLLKIFPGLERHFFPIQGAREFLEWARSRYILILATNPVWPREVVKMRVRWARIDPDIFSFITDVRSMHSCKPTREYYEEILALRGIRAEECLLVGNELKMDLPATRAGIRVFIVGPFKKAAPLRFPGAKASAWRGSFASLRRMLEAQTNAEAAGAPEVQPQT